MYAETVLPMPLVDRLTRLTRRAIERVLPWYDQGNTDARHAKTEEIRLAAIQARKQAEATERRVYAELDSYRRAADGL